MVSSEMKALTLYFRLKQNADTKYPSRAFTDVLERTSSKQHGCEDQIHGDEIAVAVPCQNMK